MNLPLPLRSALPQALRMMKAWGLGQTRQACETADWWFQRGGGVMDPLYIVELDVASEPAGASDCGDVYSRLKDHVATWLSRNTEISVRRDIFEEAGSLSLPVTSGEYVTDRLVNWTVANSTSLEATRIRVSQPLAAGLGATFVTELTAIRDENHAALHVSMGRDSTGGILTPTPVEQVRRPGIVRMVATDESLICSYRGQRIDGRYIWIQKDTVAVLRDALQQSNRLPLVVVDAGAGEVPKRFAVEAARELVGMSQVVLATRGALHELDDLLLGSGARVPAGGARLIWPDLGAWHPAWLEERLTALRKTVNQMLRTIAPLSVVARGHSVLWRMATKAAALEREQQFAAQLTEAEAQGDSQTEISALKLRVADLSHENSVWIDEITRLEADNESLKKEAASSRYWREVVLSSQVNSQAPTGVSWATAPDCDEELDDLAAFLSKNTQDAIMFTHNAIKSWKRSRYPFPAVMQETLVRLAQAALAWREGNCRIDGIMLDDWFRTQWSLAMSATDKGLEQVGKDKFKLNEIEYSRAPHIKIDDNTAPSQVGRVYFAMDSDARRFIVDHVGLKLYGL
ncbi:hypothetical protein [Kribbella sp. NPDC023855]|uniref:hypothetical protein n=1 Tax=Kribbella sp. NPDC023855 TaxID=3154698 RepID=UPI0033DE0058